MKDFNKWYLNTMEFVCFIIIIWWTCKSEAKCELNHQNPQVSPPGKTDLECAGGPQYQGLPLFV